MRLRKKEEIRIRGKLFLYYVKEHKAWALIVLALTVSFAFMFASNEKQQSALSLYTDENVVSTARLTAEKEETEATFTYKDDKAGFHIDIPEGWKRIEKDGTITYMHMDSGSSITFEVEEYDPEVNNLDETAVSSDIASDGYTFVSFEKYSSSMYEAVYQDLGNNTYDYFDETVWTTKYVVHLLCCFNDANYQNIYPYYEKILGSFGWNSDNDNVISSDYAIFYNTDTGYQFGYPYEWSAGITDSTFCAYDGTGGASLTVTSQANTGNFDDITSADIADYLNAGYTDFCMKTYVSDTDSAHAICNYTADSISYISDNYFFADGINIYVMSFTYEDGMMDEAVASDCSKLFQSYAKDLKQDSDTEAETGTGSADAENQETTKGE